MDVPFYGSVSKCLQQLGLGPAEARTWALNLDLPSWAEGTKYLSHYLLLYWEAGIRSRVSVGAYTQALRGKHL